MYREMDMDFWLEQGAEMTNSGDVGPRVSLPSKSSAPGRGEQFQRGLSETMPSRTFRQTRGPPFRFRACLTCWNITPSVFPTRRRFSLRGALR